MAGSEAVRAGVRCGLESSSRDGRVDAVTADSADYPGRPRSAPAADDLFRGSAVVRSAKDLAADGVFDDGELEDFLAAMRSREAP
jgi:hypothetical protein